MYFEIIINLFVVGYFLSMPLVGLVVALVQILRTRRPRPAGRVVEICTRQFMFWVVGMSFLCNFVFHTFFGELAASLIGWSDSPFQAEVGYASLGFAFLGFLAAFSSWSVRLGAVLAVTPFMWGAAVGHVVDMVQNGNFTAGNAGFVLWLDILLPAVGIVLLWLSRRHPVAVQAEPASSRPAVPSEIIPGRRTADAV
jgi:hypothetical protein